MNHFSSDLAAKGAHRWREIHAAARDGNVATSDGRPLAETYATWPPSYRTGSRLRPEHQREVSLEERKSRGPLMGQGQNKQRLKDGTETRGSAEVMT